MVAGASLVPQAVLGDGDALRIGYAVLLAAFLVFTHRGNIARLRAGTESRFARARLLHRWRRG